jgi:hypothetical protein
MKGAKERWEIHNTMQSVALATAISVELETLQSLRSALPKDGLTRLLILDTCALTMRLNDAGIRMSYIMSHGAGRAPRAGRRSRALRRCSVRCGVTTAPTCGRKGGGTHLREGVFAAEDKHRGFGTEVESRHGFVLGTYGNERCTIRAAHGPVGYSGSQKMVTK